MMLRPFTSSTSSICFVASVTALFVLNAAVPTVVAQDPIELCRCTAKFEHFYSHRSLMQQQQELPEDGDRALSFSNYAYDYKDYYIDEEGYYIVEGVRVLPDDDPACLESADDEEDEERVRSDTAPASAPATTPYKRDGILARVFGHGRSLMEIDEEEDMDEDRSLLLRTLMGKMGGKGGKGYDDDYYSYGSDYGKGKVRDYGHSTNIVNCELHQGAFCG
jgi:hypothetical protein